jgi:signal transduction histidine kinase
LFRNARELLANVVKHAKAGKISVVMRHHDDNLEIVVRDDGVGFAADSEAAIMRNEECFGLFSIRERMNDLGGRLKIESKPGTGCEVVLSAPLHSE